MAQNVGRGPHLPGALGPCCWPRSGHPNATAGDTDRTTVARRWRASGGAHVRLTALMAPFEYDLDRHIKLKEQREPGIFSTIDYAEELYRPKVIPGLATEVTADENGRFEIPGLPEGDIAEIEIMHPKAVTQGIRVAVREIEAVHHKKFNDQLEPTQSLYGSGFTATIPKGDVLRGHVGVGWLPSVPAASVTVARANQNSRDGMEGQQVKTDAQGRFELTGLTHLPGGHILAFVGDFEGPAASARQRIFPEENASVQLQPAVRYRLKLKDLEGHPIDREVWSTTVQKTPHFLIYDAKSHFNDAERVAPGVYQGIVPIGPAAVYVKRGAKTDRPAAVNPKAFFAPQRADWTLDEERYAYGDSWHIAQPMVTTADGISISGNQTQDQLEMAAIIFTNAQSNSDVLELTATVYSDPPVNVTLVDDAGQPVENAQVERQLNRYNAVALPATFPMYGLHPERAEFLQFKHRERNLIGTLSTTWSRDPVRVVMQSAAKLIGRFVEKSGKPNFDFGARIEGKGIAQDTFVAGRLLNPKEVPGEREGEFELEVPPGLELQGQFVRKENWVTRPPVGKAFGPLTPKPGETIDLGDLTVP